MFRTRTAGGAVALGLCFGAPLAGAVGAPVAPDTREAVITIQPWTGQPFVAVADVDTNPNNGNELWVDETALATPRFPVGTVKVVHWGGWYEPGDIDRADGLPTFTVAGGASIEVLLVDETGCAFSTPYHKFDPTKQDSVVIHCEEAPPSTTTTTTTAPVPTTVPQATAPAPTSEAPLMTEVEVETETLAVPTPEPIPTTVVEAEGQPVAESRLPATASNSRGPLTLGALVLALGTIGYLIGEALRRPRTTN